MALPETHGRGRVYNSIVDTIGDTPLVRLGRMAREAGAQVVGVTTVVDRATGAAEAIEAEGLTYRSVLGLADLGLH